MIDINNIFDTKTYFYVPLYDTTKKTFNSSCHEHAKKNIQKSPLNGEFLLDNNQQFNPKIDYSISKDLVNGFQQ